MQQWLDRFCRKHPRLTLPGLMRYIVIGNVLVYLLDFFGTNGYPIASSLLGFSADAIAHGQIWRIVTFIFVPLSGQNPVVFALSLYLYYFIGNALEREWGSNKFTIFYFFGVVLNILVGFLVGGASMHYVNLSMFFAFATLYPDLQFLLFFIIPVKAKWLAWFDAAFFALSVLRYLFQGHLLLALIPVVAIFNYLLFFATDISDQVSYWRTRAAQKRKQQQYRQAYQNPGGPKVVNFHDAKTQTKPNYLHKCAVCGKTDRTDPQMEFRYCSRCNGYYCYCADHINNHIHIQ
ncbi:MAG: rhomboid family intramembrane serine protease [Clostridiales bacterium]|nr:rhomboid family intramembrane serine protease [Clostridiales bacterium]